MPVSPFLQESLLEIDEEEDTTDFGEAFFASQNQHQDFQQPLARVTHSQPWWPSSLIPSRQSQHNKDIKLIGRDGGVQIGRKERKGKYIMIKKFSTFIDPLILASCLSPSSFLSHHLSLLGQTLGETVLLLPDIHLHELHHMMTLIHQVHITLLGKVPSSAESNKLPLYVV